MRKVDRFLLFILHIKDPLNMQSAALNHPELPERVMKHHLCHFSSPTAHTCITATGY